MNHFSMKLQDEDGKSGYNLILNRYNNLDLMAIYCMLLLRGGIQLKKDTKVLDTTVAGHVQFIERSKREALTS